jgi:hypothetical protein
VLTQQLKSPQQHTETGTCAAGGQGQLRSGLGFHRKLSSGATERLTSQPRQICLPIEKGQYSETGWVNAFEHLECADSTEPSGPAESPPALC